MTTINGVYHHNVEDILASIRTSIADEAGATRLVSGEIHMPGHHPFHSRRDAPTHGDEAAEFELPAIFKPGHHAAVEKPKLLGRLSEALKSTSPHYGPNIGPQSGPHDVGRARTVIPFDPGSANGRMIEPPAALQMAAAAPDVHAFPSQQQTTQQQSPRRNEGEVARVMPSFFDTRLNKLGEMSRDVYKPTAPEPVPQPQPAPVHRQPPTLPQGNLGDFAHHQANSAVDDAAAQLLRPMLRHWLQENMPKIVEKALLSELQGDFSPSNPHDPNKPHR